jgi:hypothetical protein
MTYFKNQFSTLLIYILLLFTGSVLTLLKVTGSSYFIIFTIAAIVAHFHGLLNSKKFSKYY